MSRPKIYVNPKFQTSNTQVHINPNFVARPAEPVVHVNPLFLQLSAPVPTPTVSESPPRVTPAQPLIRKTRHKLLRKQNSPGVPSKSDPSIHTRPQMIKVGRNKLIKANIFAGMSRLEVSKTKLKPKPNGNMYKVDNRVRVSPIGKGTKAVKATKNIQSRHKTLELKRINGTVYKTSKNRLERQRSISTGASPAATKHSDRLISLNGSKYILKESGKRLIPIKTTSVEPSSSKSTLEVAGIRFVQLMDGTYVRHHNHSSVVRQHLTTSKHKSIKILTRKLRKCNIPCPVFRRIGKCLAFVRGRCPKLHDPKYVDVCPGALRRGGCTKPSCLMSHDLSLSKMPACKYFLQGSCVNDPCLYLHNKLNENVPLCQEFLKGYCPDAERCEKRHEHLEPKQKTTRTKRKVSFFSASKKKPEVEDGATTRYFLAETSLGSSVVEDGASEAGEGPGKEISDDIFSGIPEKDQEQETRPPIGSLPAFIPI